ncbi:aminopeptidase [Clostridium oryzae]|uniref:Aminopeptidase 2 n=1 Tax=Clostridium oryzae TaxID=1450648 RepID=A0A1V4I5E2_9CLOT|nr:aminopeptidase [Clostridium oryzae]OPJ54835.1 aminopeptidase 2 [Clostridium oryzae]
MNKDYLKKYAEIIVKVGINIQDNQTLVISSPIECAEFARMAAEIAYKNGARDVVMDWDDEMSSRIKYLEAKHDDVFNEFPEWNKKYYQEYVDKGAAFLGIYASDPEIMKGVSEDRIKRNVKAKNIGLKYFNDKLMNDQNVWCVVSVPTNSWAKKVFPDVSEEEAVESLWKAIFSVTRINGGDAVKAWNDHKLAGKKRVDIMNKYNFKYLVYKNSAGTDLRIELNPKALWLGCSSFSPEGTEFIANIPTEEIFTLPSKNGVNGKVVSSKPLDYHGNLIENFSITFKDGKIVDYTAEKGYESLKSLVELDEGSHYLGEVALVQYDSPISNSKILFYNTLFDENASCHLAIGQAYPTCLQGGDKMSREQLDKEGANDSLTHVDFMIGTEDLDITGITADGKEVPVFRKGNFVF